MANKPAAKSKGGQGVAPKPQQQPQPGTSVAPLEGALILQGDKIPASELAHLQTGTVRGNENVKTEDLVIPRLEVVQGLSEAVQTGKPGYIEGAKQGDLINSVTNENYGKEVFVVNVHFAKLWLVWKDYNKGGGFFGAFPDPEAAAERLAEVVKAREALEEDLESIDTPQHLCLLVKPDGRVEEIILALAKTKAKVSRAWNTMIRLTGRDRFGKVYRVTTAMEKNKKGQEYWNFVVADAGFPAKPLFQRAENLHKSIAVGGRTINMDTKFQQPGEPVVDGDAEM